MDKKNDLYPSTFTIDNFSSTTTLAPNEIKVPIERKDVINEKQYNQYEHRNLDHPNTFIGALIHILKSSLGTGILAIPMAFKHSGLIAGFIGTLLVGMLCTHTIQLLVVASQKMCVTARVPSLGFAETAHYVFKYGPRPVRTWANFARYFVDGALVFTYFAGDAVYIVFIRDSVKQVIDFYFPENGITETVYILGIMVCLLFCCQIRPLKYLVPFSAIANVTMIAAFCITFYYMVQLIPDIDFTRLEMVKAFGLPKFLVIVIFAMEGIGTIMPVENSMLKANFLGCPGVLNIAMSVVVFMYGSMGFFGYLVFGESTRDSITYNLPQKDLAMAGRGCIAIAVFFTFMLQFYVPMEISWRHMRSHISPKHYNITQIIWRLVAVVFIAGIAISVPDLGIIIDLVGAICFSTLGLLTPAVLDIVINWDNQFGMRGWKLYKNIIIICISLFALISGTTYATQDLITKYTKKSQ